MTKVYIDTNIFINVTNAETNIYGKNISNSASDLFYQAASCKYYLIISSWTLQELYKKVKVEEVAIIFAICKNKIIKVIHDEEDIKKAKEKSPTNFDDALHVILAEKSEADYIVTRDNHFRDIKTKIPIRKPENLI